MSMFQKTVDSLIKNELDHLKEENKKEKQDAKAIYKKQTTQSKINELIEQQKKK